MFSLKISGVTYPGLLFLLMGPSFCHPYQYTRVHQKFAARMVTRNWKGIYSDLLARLHWPTLSIRRRRQKAALCYRIISNHSIIPSSLFTPHPSPKLRHHPTIIPKFVLLLIFHHSLSVWYLFGICLLYTSPSPRDATLSRMPSSA